MRVKTVGGLFILKRILSTNTKVLDVKLDPKTPTSQISQRSANRLNLRKVLLNTVFRVKTVKVYSFENGRFFPTPFERRVSVLLPSGARIMRTDGQKDLTGTDARR